ncbi:MAG: hypothetical protein EA379_01560 [Phycisphaerales bacterium]|nr:MAG: hypothetical protein EA379_01560 [Phycisphaerales bacterium]
MSGAGISAGLLGDGALGRATSRVVGWLSLFFAAMFLFAVGGKLWYALPAHETILVVTGLGDDAARLVGVMVVVWEVALAVALGVRWRLRAVSVALLATMAAFTLVTLRLVMTPGAAACGCFGEGWVAGVFAWDAREMNIAALSRNVVLLVLAAALLLKVWFGARGAARGV